MLVTTLVALLTALFGVAPVAAADGDNLRQIILDRTGTGCASYNAAGNHSSVGVGIAFDGVNLLASCYSDNTITENSPADGSLVAVHTIVGASSLGALAWDAVRGVVWACSGFSTIGTINLATNIFVPAFNPVGGCFDGLAYDGADDTLWSGYDANDQLDHSTTGGVHLATFNPGITRSGIAVGGDLLYLANNGGQQIYRAPKDVSSVTLFATFPSRLEDLECDNLTFAASGKAAIWSIDAYDNIVNAWEIPFGSCLFGGGAGQLTLTPATDENPVGSSHTVTAHLRDNNGPIAGAIIQFSVSGANTASGTGITNAAGEASLTWTGTNAGTDVVTACWDENASGVCDPTESTATATKVWAGAGAPESLTLEPETATNTAGQQHCVTATVTDANGNPTPAITVNFSVSGANTNGGVGVTDANGVASFCYTGTVAGDDDITATAVGGSNPTDTAAKTWVAGAPATLELTPPTATNTVDEEHCVTATVRDQFGNPTPGITVEFSVTPTTFRTPSSGSATTNAAGQAEFCYTSALPGNDVISAFADTNGDGDQDVGEPSDTAEKSWVLPASTAGCKVNNGGRITAANLDMATFGGMAIADGLSGSEEYQDHGPATRINVKSTEILAVTCSVDRKMASIFGTATIDGAGSFDFRIDLKDLAEPGSSDTYRIRLSNGYDSGEQVLNRGNVQIH